jgi:hypothetical protein
MVNKLLMNFRAPPKIVLAACLGRLWSERHASDTIVEKSEALVSGGLNGNPDRLPKRKGPPPAGRGRRQSSRPISGPTSGGRFRTQ